MYKVGSTVHMNYTQSYKTVKKSDTWFDNTLKEQGNKNSPMANEEFWKYRYVSWEQAEMYINNWWLFLCFKINIIRNPSIYI